MFFQYMILNGISHVGNNLFYQTVSMSNFVHVNSSGIKINPIQCTSHLACVAVDNGALVPYLTSYCL